MVLDAAAPARPEIARLKASTPASFSVQSIHESLSCIQTLPPGCDGPVQGEIVLQVVPRRSSRLHRRWKDRLVVRVAWFKGNAALLADAYSRSRGHTTYPQQPAPWLPNRRYSDAASPCSVAPGRNETARRPIGDSLHCMQCGSLREHRRSRIFKWPCCPSPWPGTSRDADPCAL